MHRQRCVDIAIAVEMLHLAGVEGAFDIGVLLTGDSDFMPAMARTRDRGKRVALATMRSCHNKLVAPASKVRSQLPLIRSADHSPKPSTPSPPRAVNLRQSTSTPVQSTLPSTPIPQTKKIPLV